jgi:hypothetical protein
MIFISYASDDFVIAQNVREKFTSAGFTVWSFDRDLKPGTEWRQSIDAAISKSDLLVVILTDLSVKSPYVTYEWAFALGRNTPIIPLLFNINDTKIHPRLTSLQAVKFTRHYQPWEDLINQVRADIGGLRLESVRPLIQNALKVVCGGISSPTTPADAKLRAFVFKKNGNSLVCTHFWAPYPVMEAIGLTFQINSDTREKVAVVKAAVEKRSVATPVNPLPKELSGISGDVERDLCYVLAAPISQNGEVTGIVDLDASSEIGKEILSRQASLNVIFDLGQHLHMLFEKRM